MAIFGVLLCLSFLILAFLAWYYNDSGIRLSAELYFVLIFGYLLFYYIDKQHFRKIPTTVQVIYKNRIYKPIEDVYIKLDSTYVHIDSVKFTR